MISQVLKLHLSSYTNDKNYSTKQLLHLCREYYYENKVELQRIDEFEKSLMASDDTLVQWYTEDTFVQRLLKKAFAHNDFEILIPFQAYIVDLRNYIKSKFETSDEYKKGENVTFSFTTRLSHDQLNQIKQNVKQLLALKGFLLCNRSCQKAIPAAWNDRKNCDKKFSAVFLLKVDTRMGATKYCNVSDDRVLLDMASVFTIDDITSLGLTELDTAYCVQLTATNDGEKLARKYHDSQKEICGDSFEICHLLLSSMNAENGSKYFEHLLVTDSGGAMEDLLAARAFTYTTADPSVAILLFSEAIQMQQHDEPPKKRDYVCTSKMLGDCYLASGETLKAMAIFKAALNYAQENQLDNYIMQAQLVCRIGQCYEKTGRFNTALMQYETACVLDAKAPKSEYSTGPGYLLSIARIFSHQERYDLAYKICIDALNTFRKVVPETHHYIQHSVRLAAEAAIKNGDLEAFREVTSILEKSKDNEPSTMCSIQ
ncbi:unnamed protein product [Rotaria sp. Silwood2]|nr:unnamed protein product [Rotaria sp. Silwood2]